VFLQKVVPPQSVMHQLSAGGAAVVYDFDDAVFTSKGDRPSRDERLFRERLETCLGACDLVITCSRFNREYAARHARCVEELLTPIDVQRYRPRPAVERPLTIGWVGSPSTTLYLRGALPMLHRVAGARPDVRFSFLGAEPFPLVGLPAAFQPWEYDSELEHLAAFDIGIMPLRPSPYVNGKAGYKLLQYMALGLPSVASPDGVNGEIVHDGVTGFLAGDAETWHARLLALIDDGPLRARMGAEARAAVERCYSVEALFPRWRGLLEAVAQRTASRRVRP
jgi:glycosyltransferase involved in cell wall biosynthesis